jgi:hypothetical protein
VEGQRAEVAQQAATKAALSKLDRVKEDIHARAEALGREADAEEDKVRVPPPVGRLLIPGDATRELPAASSCCRWYTAGGPWQCAAPNADGIQLANSGSVQRHILTLKACDTAGAADQVQHGGCGCGYRCTECRARPR